MRIRIAAALAVATAMLAAGCALNEVPGSADDEGGERLVGTLQGIGASSKKVAEETWVVGFQTAHSGVTVNYAPEGSGAGRDAFVGGGADYAGSDRAFKLEENIAGSFGKCTEDSIALDIPVYISPVAVIFNLDGIDSLNLDPTTLAKIFKGDITSWDDPAIAALNEGVALPELAITTVHRSDKSGTTENFTDYLAAVAPEVWDAEPDKVWPYPGGEAAKGTAGVTAAVSNGSGTVGYADASQAGSLGTALIGKDDVFYPATPEAAAKLVETSPIEEGRAEHDLAVELDRLGEGYPIILVSYNIVCAEYRNPETANLVKAYLTYLTSAEGQQAAAESAGSAPLSAALTEKIAAAIDSIN